MATAPVKSPTLHNFSFPVLKWGKNQMNNHRYRKSGDSARESLPLDHRSSISEAESDGGSRCEEECNSGNSMYSIGAQSARNCSCSSFPSSSSSPLMDNLQKNPVTWEEDASVVEEVSGKLLIRIHTGNKEEPKLKIKSVVPLDEGGVNRIEESAPKPWNLRPRRVVFKAPNDPGTGRACKEQENHSPLPQSENLPKSLRLRGLAEAQNVEKREKQKFSITLLVRKLRKTSL